MSIIDSKEFSILKVLSDHGKPLWKKAIHREISENIHKLPINSTFSIQTVGRRVRDMKESELLEETFTRSKEVNRTIIKGYKPSERGLNQLSEMREKILLNWVSNSLFSQKEDFETEIILEVFSSHFDVPKSLCTEYNIDYMKKIVFINQHRDFISLLGKKSFLEFSRQMKSHNENLDLNIEPVLPEE